MSDLKNSVIVRDSGRGAKPHVVIIGAGLSGLSAAISCIDAGAMVTLVEKKPRFGGATWSFIRNNLSFDSGQHVYLACCTAYQWFLDRIGTSHLAPLQGKLHLPVISPARSQTSLPKISYLKRTDLPAPLHLAGSIARYSHISAADRAKLSLAALALMRLDLDDDSLDNQTFGGFLKSHGQSDTVIANFWEIINLATTNVRADEVSLAVSAKVFKTLLRENTAGDIGWSTVPLNDLHGTPAVELLKHSGANILKRAKVAAILKDAENSDESVSGESSRNQKVHGVSVDGYDLTADAVIVAADHLDTAELLATSGMSLNKNVHEMKYSPIMNIHFAFDTDVMAFKIAAAVNSPAQFIFDTTVSSGLEKKDGQCLTISVSAAHDEIGLAPKVLIDKYHDELLRLFPKTREAKIVDAVVSREVKATMKATPGTKQLRPEAVTDYQNLFLAGAWTNTGWPITMESAVISGLKASKLALQYLGFKKSSEQIGEGVLNW